MDKPAEYYLSYKFPYKEWKPEWKEYKSYRRRLLRNPTTADLSKEERAKIKIKVAKENIKKSHEKYSSISDEEKSIWNKHKVLYRDKLSDDEKELRDTALQNGCTKFWNNLSPEERKEFSIKRWNSIDKSTQEKIINNLKIQSKKYFESLTKDDIDKQVKIMQNGYWEKYNNDNEFRDSQINKLIENNKKFYDSLSQEERKELIKKRTTKAHEKLKYLRANDEDYIKKESEHLQKHCRDYIDSLSPEELSNHIIKLNNSLEDYYKNMSSMERNQILHDNKFNKKFENKFNESILSNDFYFIKEYEVRLDSTNFKFWDYAIFSKESNKLVMVVDLDGEYFHGDNSDYDGLHSKEERDEKRAFYIPGKDVKVFIFTEKNFNILFEEMLKLLISDYDKYIKDLFNDYRSIDFPYPYYSHKELINSMIQLCNMKCDDKYHKNVSLNTRIGDRLINHFHHSIYSAHVKNKPSPYEAWYDDELLMKCIENRVLYRSTLNPNKILQGFNVCKIAPKVSVFSAGRAKMLIYKYLNEFDQIFDPFSGFSGRMLGTISLGKTYIGQDVSPIHVGESIEIIQFIYQCKSNFPNIGDAYLEYKDILKSHGNYQCLFTCPPYSDKEQWLDVPITNKSCDDWIDECLNRFKCKRYLFVVDTTEKYKDYIVDEIHNKSHFNQNTVYVIMIDK